MSAERAKNSEGSSTPENTNQSDKAQTEILRKGLGQKLKDPELAKKAAQIIEEMLKKFGRRP